MDSYRTDAILIEILNDRKTIFGFLDSIFGFLSRCSDFYCEMKSEDDKIGFPKGLAEQIVRDMFRKHKRIYKEIRMKPAEDDSVAIPEASEEMIVEGCVEEVVASECYKPPQLPERSSINEVFQSSESYNGAKFENYCWSQTIADIELHVKLSPELLSSKKISVDTTSTGIKIFEKNSPNTEILSGTFCKKVKHTETIWSIVGNKLQISLEKQKELWWDRLLISEPKIDVKKIDCSRDIDDMPEDSHAVLERFHDDQSRKLQRSIDESQKLEMLRRAWDLDGSPWKGQPFDPNVLQHQ